MSEAYLEVISFVEQLHRRFLEIVKLELDGLVAGRLRVELRRHDDEVLAREALGAVDPVVARLGRSNINLKPSSCR